jgi:hypothetical protein
VNAARASCALGRHGTIVERRDIVNTSAYDSVIAGGGIAGLTVADGLIEDPNSTQTYRIAKCSLTQTQHRSDASFYNMCATLGARGWFWQDLLPYFKKSETFNKLDR